VFFLENARYPYLATVILDGMQYGIGIGSSKKQAKLDAARATLEILLPSVKNHIQINRRHAMNERQGCSNFDGDVVSTLCSKYKVYYLELVIYKYLINHFIHVTWYFSFLIN